MKFFRRQFSPEITNRQFQFDVVFGILTSIFSVAIDLALFDGVIGNSKIFSYTAFIINVISLTVWLLFYSKLRPLLIGLIAGILLSGAVYASALAYFVGYFTLWGFVVSIALAGFNYKIMGLAVLGFLPILSVFVFLRNGVRALQISLGKISGVKLTALVLLSMIIMCFVTTQTLSQPW